ncbi:hypothetical protein TNCV_4320491 [Trichonephila clavipes]|nr:hypothetical protein TNCV_4320491 [Trichonephila clavipes]
MSSSTFTWQVSLTKVFLQSAGNRHVYESSTTTAVLHKELESIDSSVLYLELWLAWCCDLVFDGGRGFRNRIQWGGRWLAWRTESTNEMDDGTLSDSSNEESLNANFDVTLEIIGERSGDVLCSIKAVSVLMPVIQWWNGEHYWSPERSDFGSQAVLGVSQAMEPL